MSRKINVGLVGFGLSGQVFHAPFIDLNPNFKLVKIIDLEGTKANEIYPYVEVVNDISCLLKNVQST